MRTLRLMLALAALALPMAAHAALDADDLPAASTWYFHVDFEEMRSSDAGRSLYDWLENEVFADILEETGIDIGKEADEVTAFSSGDSGFVLVMEGPVSDATEDKVLAVASVANRLETMKTRGKTFYFVSERGGDADAGARIDIDGGNIEIDGLDDEAYFSFALKNKVLVTANREQMESLLASGGRVPGKKGHDGALFVLTAERSLVQAGFDASELGDDGNEGFKSNIMRNTRQVAFMIADVAGKVAIEAQLIATEPEMANSLASIVRGLIALQAFSEDMDADVREFLQSLRIDVDDTLLKISVALSPETVAATLDDA